jgi:alpha-L-rhamnosidase
LDGAGPGSISWVKAEYASVQGLIKSEWHLSKDRYSLNVTVPANTQAKIWLPAKAAGQVTESGHPLAQAAGVRVLGAEDDGLALQVLAGTYSFTVDLAGSPSKGQAPQPIL